MHAGVRCSLFLLLALGAALVAGCGRKEVTSLQRKQGANLASEAAFAITLHDYARAETLLAQAVAACPDAAEYWLNLGMTRRRLGNRAGAKTAYGEALDQLKEKYRKDGKNPEPLLQQVYVFALLGRMDDARGTLERAQKNHAGDRTVRAFVEGRQLERLPDDPVFKDVAL